PFAFLERILLLRFYVTVADFNGVQFIPANAPIDEFQTACLDIEKPFVTALHKRDRKRPVLFAHQEKGAVSPRWIHGNTFLFAGFGSEGRGLLPIERSFTGKNNIAAIRSENL